MPPFERAEAVDGERLGPDLGHHVGLAQAEETDQDELHGAGVALLARGGVVGDHPPRVAVAIGIRAEAELGDRAPARRRDQDVRDLVADALDGEPARAEDSPVPRVADAAIDAAREADLGARDDARDEDAELPLDGASLRGDSPGHRMVLAGSPRGAHRSVARRAVVASSAMKLARVLGCWLALASGCGAPPVAPPAPTAGPVAAPAAPLPPEKTTVETGKPCAKAQVSCDGGLCTIEVDNGCDQPVSCDAGAVATCKTDAEMVEATGRGRDTFPAKTKGKLTVAADCTKGVVMTSHLKEMHCH